jgi:hypothetical protein
MWKLFKKKESETFERAIHFVTNEEGEKFLSIREFTLFLAEYKLQITNDSQIEILDQLIKELNNA